VRAAIDALAGICRKHGPAPARLDVGNDPRFMPEVIGLDEFAAMIAADPFGHRYETSPDRPMGPPRLMVVRAAHRRHRPGRT
jgi:hypothetical protein